MHDCCLPHAGGFTAPVEAHNVLALRISPTAASEAHERWRPWAPSSGSSSEPLLQGSLLGTEVGVDDMPVFSSA